MKGNMLMSKPHVQYFCQNLNHIVDDTVPVSIINTHLYIQCLCYRLKIMLLQALTRETVYVYFLQHKLFAYMLLLHSHLVRNSIIHLVSIWVLY